MKPSTTALASSSSEPMRVNSSGLRKRAGEVATPDVGATLVCAGCGIVSLFVFRQNIGIEAPSLTDCYGDFGMRISDFVLFRNF